MFEKMFRVFPNMRAIFRGRNLLGTESTYDFPE
jgi:hypothetical protein